ncbi:MAG: hypothetical protein Q8L43_05980, partial [Deltaproteobacteria bacterium]|nr:hypothetical protein [Deltaproteobacteria bacterium]
CGRLSCSRLKAAGETSEPAANFHRDPGLKAKSLRVRHNSTKFFEKAILPKILSLPDHGLPGTTVMTGVNQAVTPGVPWP